MPRTVSEIPLGTVADRSLEVVADMRAPLVGGDVIEVVSAGNAGGGPLVGGAHPGGADRAAAGSRP